MPPNKYSEQDIEYLSSQLEATKSQLDNADRKRKPTASSWKHIYYNYNMLQNQFLQKFRLHVSLHLLQLHMFLLFTHYQSHQLH